MKDRRVITNGMQVPKKSMNEKIKEYAIVHKLETRNEMKQELRSLLVRYLEDLSSPKFIVSI